MKISVLFIVLISYVWNIHCAATGISDVASVLSSVGHNVVQLKSAAVKPVVGESLGSPSDATTFGPMLNSGVLIEPVQTNGNGILSQFPTNTNIPIPILIKDDNLLIKTPHTETTPKPILIRDDNLMLTGAKEATNTELAPEPTPKPILYIDNNLMLTGGKEATNTELAPEPTQKPILYIDNHLMLTGVKEAKNTELAPEPTPKPILYIDNNLMLTGGKEATNTELAPEPTPKPILYTDNNLMLTGGKKMTNTELAPEPTPKHILYTDNNLMLTGGKEATNTELAPEITPEPILYTDNNLMLTGGNEMTNTELAIEHTPKPVLSAHQNMKPCPEFNSRYEKGSFVVTLDDGKCEMIVNQKPVQEKQSNPWAPGRHSPVYELLTRKYNPEVTFRQTALAPKDHHCHHHTRKMGSFFVVDTVLGRCQMVIGIPTLPDLRYIMSNTRPAWSPPMRKLPRWPRRSSESDSDD
ncbi:uncharacterized protein LOC134720926 [Mytilus trossulus]|uniref:uncharacterized protein LOC134720926 n=1 Tax=Mytilus trossulus TaxID=6551 RepID=UPI003004BF57